MKDLIDREAALNCFHSWVDKYGDVYTPDEIPEYQAIEALPSAQPEQRWIPCSERLPDAECGESDIVLATCGYMNVKDTSVRWIKTLYFNGGNWCYPTGETYEQKVYAWMPLPEPYKEDDRMKDDTISRQAVLKLLSAMPPEDATTKALLIQSVKQMDAAQPERKRGKWIDYANSHCECSVCHTEWSYFQNEVECFEFCPNCGADMREDDHETD